MQTAEPILATTVPTLVDRGKAWALGRSRKEVAIAAAAVFMCGAVAMNIEFLLGYSFGPLSLLAGILLVVLAGVLLGAVARWPRIWKPGLICGGVLGFVVMIWLGTKRVTIERWTSDSGTRIVDRFYGWGHTPYWESLDSDNFFSSGPLSPSGKRHGEWTSSGRRRWYWYGDEISEGEWHLRNK